MTQSAYRRRMLSDKKILVTGVTGQIGFPLARFLAEKNEVWGVARFTDEQNKERVEGLGVHTLLLI